MKEGISKAVDLSEKSKEIYLQRLKSWKDGTGKTVLTVIRNPKKYIKWLKENKKELHTQKAYIAVIMAMFKHTDGLKDKYKTAHDEWYEEYNKITKEIEEQYKSNLPSERQKDGFVSLKEIIEKRDALPVGSKERLLLSMYTYIPPLRNDYNRVLIVPEGEVVKKGESNYLLMKEGKLVIGDHKTARAIGAYENILPDELMKEIKTSLEMRPRSWLFSNEEDEPYSSNTFNRWVNRVLSKVVKEGLTITIIRHIYITEIDYNRCSIKEKEKVGKLMCHGVSMQDRYRLLL